LEGHRLLKDLNRKIEETGENTLAIFILLLCFIYLFTISLISDGLYGDTDSIAHYQLARFAFRHPSLFFDHWGKPLFTMLSAPFAQFGLQGSILFNIICGLLSAWLIYRMAKEYNFKYSLLAIPFSLFAPIYMVTLFTSLTEILFGLVLVSSIYFFLKQKNILSAIIISFIPFARTEGMMFLLIFLFGFLLLKKFKAIPFLLMGFIVYSLGGYFVYRKIFWFFTAMPYSEKGSELYGSGSFWFYFERFHQLLGFPLTVLAVLGIIWLGVLLFRKKKPVLTPAWLTEYYLIPVSIFGFILAHSFLWWKGLMAVLSSPRFMASIMPLCGFLAVAGFNFMIPYLGKNKLIKRLLVIAILALLLYVPYSLYEIPARLASNSEVMKATANKLMKIGYRKKQLIYFDPKLAFYLHDDPFYRSKANLGVPDMLKKDFGMTDSSLLIWDTHFAEFETKIYLEDMLKNPDFRIIDGFKPEEEFKFRTGQNYMAIIFQKVPFRNPQDNWTRIDSIDFETADTEENLDHLTDSVAYTGLKSNQVGGGGWEFSNAIKRELKDIPVSHKVLFRARLEALITERATPEKLYLVLEIHNADNKQLRYVSIGGSYFKPEPGKWFQMSLVTPLQTDFPVNGSMVVYAWYPGNDKIYVDDLVLEYIPLIQ
jgi:hypothetical protein